MLLTWVGMAEELGKKDEAEPTALSSGIARESSWRVSSLSEDPFKGYDLRIKSGLS